ncbi:hypothetical protein, partial [Paracraurococcus ruber]|uniref:hypothetical protein n=1 Tax=Paracraurococcus ruber TaxID=77675 RepID=UPI00195FD690
PRCDTMLPADAAHHLADHWVAGVELMPSQAVRGGDRRQPPLYGADPQAVGLGRQIGANGLRLSGEGIQAMRSGPGGEAVQVALVGLAKLVGESPAGLVGL